MYDDITNEYFEWLYRKTLDKHHRNFRKLLYLLHEIEFRYSIDMDCNRYDDGVDLRYRFACEIGDRDAVDYLDGPCTVLEMLVALSIRCEESIMDDPEIGDRTAYWFWLMLDNIGIGYMSNNLFNKDLAMRKIDRFLDRKYKRNGEGGLFILDNPKVDMRDVQIWYQMCLYLDTIV